MVRIEELDDLGDDEPQVRQRGPAAATADKKTVVEKAPSTKTNGESGEEVGLVEGQGNGEESPEGEEVIIN
jgi:hypothetical protein